MSCWRDKVQASMNSTVIVDIKVSLDLQFFLKISFILCINVFDDYLRTEYFKIAFFSLLNKTFSPCQVGLQILLFQ